MKKTLSLILAFVMVILTIPMTAATVSAETDGYYTYTVTDGKATITDVDTSISGDITIPATLGGYSVTSIGNSAFAWCGNLTSITIPNSVTSIGNGAFYYCDDLTSINVSNSNTAYKSIDGALLTKDGTVLIQYPIGNTRSAYSIPNSVTSISEDAFKYCTNLKSVTIPNSVTSIGEDTFWGCGSLASVTIPNSVTSIGKWAFTGCESLTSVTISESVTSIGKWAFYNCKSLTNVNVSNSNTAYKSIDGVLFTKDGTELIQYPIGNTRSAYSIPNSVTSIGDDAFAYCKNLTSVTIPNSVTSIGDEAFKNCENFTSVTIPNSVTNVGDWAFYSCTNLTSITISNGVTSIGDWAFEYCESLSSVTIPDSVTSIGLGVFYTCKGLKSINVSENNTAYKSIDGVLFTKDGTELIQYPIGNTRTEYSIPNSVTSIGNDAFHKCTNLTSVTIPNSVTSIGSYVFEYCTSLTSITIPNSVTSIGKWVFWECESLTSVTIPNSLTSIGSYAFSGCESITSVYYAGSRDEWNSIELGTSNEELTSAQYFHYNAPNPETHYEYNIIEESGCTKDGKATAVCSCGYSISEVVLPATGHNYQNEVCVNCGKALTYGDANSDGKVNLSDASTMLKYIAKWDIRMDTKAADVNRDGKINLNDVSLILKYIAKWNVTLG